MSVEAFVNDFLEKEGAKAIKDDELLANSTLDSFGYLLLDAELQKEYGRGFLCETLDYGSLRLCDVAAAVEGKSVTEEDNRDYKIEPIGQKDMPSLSRVLLKELDYKDFTKHVKEHVRRGIAYKMVQDGNMVAFFLAKRFEKNYSLTHFFLDERVRKKKGAFFFFLYCLRKIQGLPIFIEANKNIKEYERYFKKTSQKNVYLFEGLRKETEWAELLTQEKTY